MGGVQMQWDLIIIGSGAGGGTLARALSGTGLRVLILERGGFLPQEPQNWSARAVFRDERYRTPDIWRDALTGRSIRPYEYHFVGGKTKLYGSALLRFREKDFESTALPGGDISPAWPFPYTELEPWYQKAEDLYRVHGDPELDPNHPPRSAPLPFGPIPFDDYMSDLAGRLKKAGVRPGVVPLGIDLKRQGGACVFCSTCDGYPCQVLAKSDADTVGVRPALKDGRVEIWTRARVEKLGVSDGNPERIDHIEVDHDGVKKKVFARGFVLSAGAVASAALLLRSSAPGHPQGLGNSSGMVGRNLMFHNHSGVVAIHPFRRNTTRFQKAIALTDFYLGDQQFPHPMGMIQFLGAFPLEHQGLGPLGKYITEHSIQVTCLSEDLPDPENRVLIGKDGMIELAYRHNNERAHGELVKRAKRLLRASGFSVVLSKRIPMPQHAGGHVCGTLGMGLDPRKSVLDSNCRSHDIKNLWVVDSSFLPTSGAVNPSLTIMAQALRVAPRIALEITQN